MDATTGTLPITERNNILRLNNFLAPTHDYHALLERAILTSGLRKGFSEKHYSYDVSFLDGRVPYENSLPDEEHQATLERLGRWLLHENILSPFLLHEKARNHLSSAQWNMMKDNPEHYWSIVLANGLAEQKYYALFKSYVPAPFTKTYEQYETMQEAWIWVNKEIYKEKRRHRLSSDEEISMVFVLSDRFRAFFTLETHALGREVSYPWASEVLESYHHTGRNMKSRELGER